MGVPVGGVTGNPAVWQWSSLPRNRAVFGSELVNKGTNQWERMIGGLRLAKGMAGEQYDGTSW